MNSRVGLKVSVVDRFDELLCDLYYLLLASCWEETPWERCDQIPKWWSSPSHRRKHFITTIRGWTSESRELVIRLKSCSSVLISSVGCQTETKVFIPPIICLGASTSIYHPSDLLFACEAAWPHHFDEACRRVWQCPSPDTFSPLRHEVLTRSDSVPPSHPIIPPPSPYPVHFVCVPFTIINS